MKNRSLLIQNESLIGYYIEREENPTIKYRLAFLNSLKMLEYDVEKACEIFIIAIPTAYAWARKWNDEGYSGIAHPSHESDRPVGRPPKLKSEDLTKLKDLLSERSNWLGYEIRELIIEKFGIEFSLSQVERIVREKLKMHFSKPYPHDYRRPPDAEEQLMENLEKAYNDLKNQGVNREKVAVGCLDETSPQTTANTVRFWHFGHGDIVKNTSKYKANTIGFYAIYGHDVLDFIPDSKKESIMEFLDKIRKANSDYEAVIVVLDQFSSHLAKETQNKAQSLGIILVPLPPYSPDLNPIEQIWKTIRRDISVNFISSVEHLKYIISDIWNDIVESRSSAKGWIEEFTPWINYREMKI